MKKTRYLISVLILMILLVACSEQDNNKISLDNEINEDTEAIYNTIEDYYNLVMDGKFEQSYDYLSAKSKKDFPLKDYIEYEDIRSKAYNLTDYEIEKLENTTDDKIMVFMNNTRINKFYSDGKDNSTPEIVFLEKEDNNYKIELGDLFKYYTSWSYDSVAFEKLWNDDKDYDEVIYLSKKSLEIEPLNHRAYDNIVAAYTLSKNSDLALETISEYLTLYKYMDNEDDRVLANMYHQKGYNLWVKDNIEGAIKAFSKSLEIDPNNEKAMDAIVELKKY